MKLKNIVGTLAAMAAMALMAVGVQAATYSVGAVQGTAGGTVALPVQITPDSGETATINGYAISYKYDNTKITPVTLDNSDEDTDSIYDDESLYATAGTSFDNANAVIVSDNVDNGDGTSTLTVAWASADAISVTEAAELSAVSFTIAEDASDSVPITVTSAVVVEDASVGDTQQTVEAASGSIDLGSFLRGDANGDSAVDILDAKKISQYINNLETIDEKYTLQADANADGAVDVLDAKKIAQYINNLETIPE